jgi:hypothetical protein
MSKIGQYVFEQQENECPVDVLNEICETEIFSDYSDFERINKEVSCKNRDELPF